MEITPFIPLILRGRFKESTYFKGGQWREEVVWAFKHLDFNCHLDFDIWNLAAGIATPRQVGARNDNDIGSGLIPDREAEMDSSS